MKPRAPAPGDAPLHDGDVLDNQQAGALAIASGQMSDLGPATTAVLTAERRLSFATLIDGQNIQPVKQPELCDDKGATPIKRVAADNVLPLAAS